jgi:uncharacterized protein (TIGR03435 family)
VRLRVPRPHGHGSEPRASASGTENRGAASFRNLVLAILLTSPLLAQGPQFEVASIKPFDPNLPGQTAGIHFDGAQVRGVGLSLRDYLATAYRLKATLISGPDWTATELFNISATLPEGGSRAQVPEMLQALLADRFHVKLRKDKKELPIFALVLAKGGLKMKELPPDPDADPEKDEPIGMANVATIAAIGTGISVTYARGASISVADNRIEVRKLPLWVVCRNLERYSDREIVDMTGLTGSYTFTLDVTPEDFQAMNLRAAVVRGFSLPPDAQKFLDSTTPFALSDALQQVGLKLEARKAPIDVLVIDDALKTPTAN